MPEEVIKPIEVYEPDLVEIHDTLSTVYHFCISYDLFNQYKNLSNSVQPSPLTKQINKMRNRVQGYLEDAQTEQEAAGTDNSDES